MLRSIAVAALTALLVPSTALRAGTFASGPKLVGAGAVGGSGQGSSVALSSDGSTALVGGAYDDTSGAAWVFTRSSGPWTQQGDKLVGTGMAGSGAFQGASVALSADGNTDRKSVV